MLVALESQLIVTLRTLLRYDITYFVLLFLIFLYVFTNLERQSIYNSNTTIIRGIVIKIDYENNPKMIVKAKENILVYLNEEKFSLGDEVVLFGKTNALKDNRNFNLFNYKNYLKSQSIYWSFNIEKVVKQQPSSTLLYKVKNNLNNRLNKYASRDYLKALVMADTSDLELETYQINGVSHLFSISGLHIHAISFFLLYVLKYITKRTLISHIFVSVFLILYLIFTNATASIFRSVVYFILSFFNKTFNLYIKPIHILVLTLIIVLLYNPLIIYSVGFQFTFVISAHLILFKKIIERQKNYVFKSLAISLIAFLASIPILAVNYYSINLLSPLLNLIFVPLITFIVFPLVLLTPFLPNDQALSLAINAFEKLSIFFNHYQIELILAKPSYTLVLVYYIVIYYTLKQIRYRKYNAIALVIVLIFLHHNNAHFAPPTLHMIDVGQGDCFLITTKNNNILVDTGGLIHYDVAKKTIIPYLKSMGVKKLDYLILTHGDYDHIGASTTLLKNFNVANVILNSGVVNELEGEIIKVVRENNIPYYHLNEYDLVLKDIRMSFLNKKSLISENADSLVLLISINQYRILLMGDALIENEAYILDKYKLPQIDVLKVGHHGSKTSSSKSFIDSINQQYSIISVGENNRYKHPNNEVLENLKNTKIYRTDQNGGILFKIKNNKLEIKTRIS